MKDGFIKVAAGTPRVKVADCNYNTANMIQLIKEADKQKANLLVFPELGITSYTCGDLFFQDTLISGALRSLKDLITASDGMQMLVAVGLPMMKDGKLFNCCAVVFNGSLLGIIPKTHLPNYNEFQELRYFNPAPDENTQINLWGKEYPFGTKLLFACMQIPSFRLGVEICEDLWVANPPSIGHALAGATILANLSASDEIIGKDHYRRELVTGQSTKLISGYVYCDAGEGESTTDLVFAGHNLIAENGTLLKESKLFQTGLIFSEIDVAKIESERRKTTTFSITNADSYLKIPFSIEKKETSLTRIIGKHPFVPVSLDDRAKRCEAILAIQSHGLKKRLEHAHSKTAVIGISGGLDSSLAILVTVCAMDLLKRPRTDIIAVTMPCFGTTKRTKGNAELLCETLGVTLKHIDITDAVIQHFKDIDHSIDQHDVTYENAQARERTQILMDIANKHNGLVIGTGDLSELALGWATYNGDHMSMYGVNSSIPKTLVRHIVKYAAEYPDAFSKNRKEELSSVLLDILDTPVSPELLPADDETITQKTEDIVGPYELHDFFIYYSVRYGFSPSKILRLAQYAYEDIYSRETILHWLKVYYRRFFQQQFKRSCLPDGPKVGTVAFSPRGDWRMPSDACANLWLSELETL